MKTIIISLLALGIGLAGGIGGYPYVMGLTNSTAEPMDGTDSTDNPVDYWVAPMDPHFRRDKPGKSPMGMDLVPVYRQTGDAAQDDPDAVTIQPAIINNLGVRTATVKRGPMAKHIKTVGYVRYDETRVNHVHSRTDGWLEKLYVKSEGEYVRRGQVLFELYSPAVVNAQEEYLLVLKSNIKGLKYSGETRLSALGMANRQIKQLQKRGKPFQRIRVYAPRSGVISKLNVGEGMYIKPEMNVMVIADLSSVWLMVDVFERQANWVEKGQKVDARFSYLPGTDWNGVVDYIYPDLDPMTRTFKVRLRFKNPGGKLKPNMYGKVNVYTQEKLQALSIPREAIIRGGHENHVVLKTASGSFKQQTVEIGIESGDQVEILSGLNVGDTVVISAQFLIDSEASLKASFTRMSPLATPTETTHDIPQFEGTGVIEAVQRKNHVLTLTHEPIAALEWPEMTMDLAVDKALSLDNLKKGQRILFVMDKHTENTYIITEITCMGDKQ